MINAIIIESSPAFPVVLPASPTTQPDTDPALPSVLPASPQYYIAVATQGDNAPRPYPLETAPIETFNNWVNAIIATERIDDPLCLFFIKKHSQTWDDLGRLWVLIDFKVRGIDVSKYAYASMEAAMAAVEAQ